MRIIAGHQQVVRLDKDDLTEVDPPPNLASMVEWAEVVLISDYKKGLVNQRLLQQLDKCLSLCKKPVLIDPYDGRCDYLTTPTLMKPNKKEIESVTGVTITDGISLTVAAQKYMTKSGTQNLVITLGADGMALFDRKKYLVHPYRVNSVAQQVFDVTGAGDTVIAVLAYMWAVVLKGKASRTEAIDLANKAAGLVVAKLGTATVSFDELFDNYFSKGV
jgi:D-beta-D-heptose 7-phosphate kinase/D-beta-D-heptose 1-phosphate adenosyltransferase